MAEGKNKKQRAQTTKQRLDAVEKSVDVLENELTRRDFVSAGVGVVGTLLILGAGKIGWRRATRLGLKPKFDVYILNDERMEKLPPEKKKLSDSYFGRDGYIAVSFISKDKHAKADIHHKYNEFIGKGVQERTERAYIERSIAGGEFTFVASGPKIGSQRKFKVEREFLGNSQLLKEIIEVDKLEKEGKYQKKMETLPKLKISSFEFRDYFGHEVPDKCEVEVEDVTYHVDGMDALVYDDKHMFAEFWLARHKYKDFAAFKTAYEEFEKIRAGVEKFGSGEGKISKILNSFSEKRSQYASYKDFRAEYEGFAARAGRIEAARAVEVN